MRQTKRERDRGRKSRRKSESRRLNKTRRIRKKSPQKGGFAYGTSGVVYANEGVVIYPSILSNSYDAITKIYYKKRYYDIEKSKYNIFDSVDPGYKYHSQIYSHGELIPSTYLSDDLKEKIKKIEVDKPQVYIDMEYAGETLGSIQDTSDPKLRKAVLLFFIDVLQLQNDEGLYLVHGDPHPGNICYKIDSNGDYIIKYIDITQLELNPGNKEIKSDNDSYNIRAQFSSLLGTMRHVFGYVDNQIANKLSGIEKIGNTYKNVLGQVLRVLHDNII